MPRQVERHLEEFEKIADAHGGNRASGTEGHAASVRYTEGLLRRAGYRTYRQPFRFRYTRTLEERLTLRGGASPEVVVAGYSPSTPASGLAARPAPLTGPPEQRQGCEPADHAGAGTVGSGSAGSGTAGSGSAGSGTAGRIALVTAGGCSADAKARAGAAAGAVAVLVVSEGAQPPHDWLADPDGARVPVGGVSRETGRTLAAEARAARPVRLTLRSLTEHRTTENLVAVSREGDPRHTVTAGAHLDSVPEGPGINDNGVAAATLLESALTQAREAREARRTGGGERNRLVFGFWAAEEFGLLGSRHYVNSLSQRARSATALYLNLEMIGSPNHALFTLDSRAADPESGLRPAPGSEEIERRLAGQFARQGERSRPAPADGRSDYVPFLTAGIPTGGLYGGSFETKTRRQAALWGGRAGAPFDSCYHLPCDRTAHYGRAAAALHGQAFHGVLSHYARHRLPGTARPGGQERRR